MKIKVVSDLHLEFSDVNIPNDENCDVLIMSGDIMIAEDLHDHPESSYGMYSNVNLDNLGRRQAKAQRFRDFLKRVSFQFPHVVYIAGNHEFYHGRWDASLDHLREECAKFPNVYFLERDMKVIDDVVFVGGTLWTDMNKEDSLTMFTIRSIMNDFKVIKKDNDNWTNLKPADTTIRHRQTLDYIRLIVDDNKDKKCVVVGHHSPSFLSAHAMYKDDTLMNGAYHSSLEEFIMDRPQIKLWTHGHTHYAFDYVIGETRVVCNPRGYEGHEPYGGWDKTKFIEI
jgi:Icc-related predicted phosphoesterase